MINFIIGAVSFAAIFGGVLIGRFAARRIPGHHLSNETQSAVNVSVAVIGTLSALVLGLMISAANTSFSKRSDEVRELSLQMIRIERNLRRYGPEGNEARSKLREWATNRLERLSDPSIQPAIDKLEGMQDALLVLTPKHERQKYLRTICLTLSSTLIYERWSLEEHEGHSIPVPFLILLIFWLTIVFASFGLFAPANQTAIVVLFLCSVAVAGGIYLIEELDNPHSGLIRVPVETMQKALVEITQ